MYDFWQKQEANEPLFSDLLWSKPENKQSAGKLLIIGGQKDHFSKVSSIYENATKAGAGYTKLLLPSSLEKIVHFLPNIELAQSNNSGSFALSSLAQMQDLSSWSDAVILAGDFGKSSETSGLLDRYIKMSDKLLAVASSSFDVIDISLLNKNNVLICTNLSGLQALQKGYGFDRAFTSSLGLPIFAQYLRDFSRTKNFKLVCQFSGRLWVASNSRISSTPVEGALEKILAFTSVWLMQNPNKPLEALTTACYELTLK